jgi:acetyl-CoA carboxylase carboxyl transferase subunit beta
MAAFDFAFVGGTLGVATGRKLVRLLELATDRRLPAVLVTASGGVRVQEGVAALFQMAAVGAAAAAHRDAGLLQIAVLDDPTTGGVAAGFALAADVVVAAPGARVSVAGGRTAAAMGRLGPADVHVGFAIDVLAHPHEQRPVVARLLGMLAGEPTPGPGTVSHEWPECVTDDAVELAGDRRGVASAGVRTGIAAVDGSAFVWILLGRGERPPGPAAFAKARRRLDWAARLRLPVVTLIDAPGADVSFEAETANLAGEVALTLAAFTRIPTPTLAIVDGTGGGGPVMALAAADRLVMTEGSDFYVLPPAAVAALLDRSRPSEPGAGRTGTTAADLLAAGIVDDVVPATDEARAEVLRRFLKDPPQAGNRYRRWAG